MEMLGHPEHSFKSVHIAGTNGKGSTSHMLAAVFQEAGYKTGLYTSPHLLDFRERIRVDGQMISQQVVIDFVEKYQEEFSGIQPSFFEWTVALAFYYFRQEKVDIAIIETGLGGRLDSTNVITPELSIITNISMDHANLLGDRLELIAAEKAGIIKKDIPVVIGERMDKSAHVFEQTANERSTSVLFASDIRTAYQKENSSTQQTLDVYRQDELEFANLIVDLAGNYQLQNCCTVLTALEVLRANGWNITEEKIRIAMGRVRSATGLMGRWQVISENPVVLCDVGHNEDGIRQVVRQLQGMQFRRLHFVIGMVRDKDISKVIELLPKEATYYFTQPQLPRALSVNDAGQEAGLNGKVFPTVLEAVKSAQFLASEDDLIFIGGSTFVVAEALALFY
jgi:dihydrofolate synthase/folylpolyglutamate synthase